MFDFRANSLAGGWPFFVPVLRDTPLLLFSLARDRLKQGQHLLRGELRLDTPEHLLGLHLRADGFKPALHEKTGRAREVIKAA